jgi:hypothetical protein
MSFDPPGPGFWSLDSAAPEAALALGGSLGRFWCVRGHVAEGRRWLEEALGASAGADSSDRARALRVAALLANYVGDLDSAELLAAGALALSARIARNGEVLEQTSGFKQLAVRQHPDGHTHQEPVSRELAEKPCSTAPSSVVFTSLPHGATTSTEPIPMTSNGHSRRTTFHLLQRRPITTSLICRELHTHPEFSEGQLAITHRRKPASSGRRVHGSAPGWPGCQEPHGCSGEH